ncbi:uncharacterized protein LOC119463449 [Dermacentor silvarum]|uniref:uncharacterized protein LOC119463449 n=1 Tax=Dermacentor silvarum TaxID=543639 RepID=UPI001899B7E1|nr:uncharacterized protein LOC119463449 [Dermacentor silvarum]
MLGAFRTTRTAALQVLMRAPPLALELDRANAEFHLFALRVPVTYGELSISPRQVLFPVDPWDAHPADARTFSFRRLSRNEAFQASRSEGVHVFTDGSFTSLSSGAAFVVLGPRGRIGAVGRYSVSEATSAYCAELIAFMEALAHIRGRGVRVPVHMYTDCLSLLCALSVPSTADPRINNIKALLHEISRSTTVCLYLVPGHSGVFGNELADFLASRAAVVGAQRVAPMSLAAIRSAFRRAQRAQWARQWQRDNADTALFRWVPRLDELPPFFPPPRPLVTLLTEHGRFPFYFYRFRLMSEPRCPCGALCESMEHYIYECSITREIAQTMAPSAALASRNFPVLLKSPRNRAILIRITHLVSASIPDVSK